MQFSVIIPAKNEETNIDRCLKSLKLVEWEKDDYEIIVVDNGSMDGTVFVARKQGAVVHVKPGLSVAALRNFGAMKARGSTLVFLDADCTVSTGWLQRAVPYLHQSEVACFGSPPVPPEQATWVQKAWFAIRKKNGVRETAWLESMNMFVSREAFEAVRGFDETLVTCEDYDLSVRIRRFGKIITDDRIVAVHHGEAGSLRQLFRKECWRGTSNLSGIMRHGFSWEELPSVALPLIHAALLSLVSGFLAAALVREQGFMVPVLFFTLWQVPLVALAFWKNRGGGSPLQAIRLCLLLNVYFTARACALFRSI